MSESTFDTLRLHIYLDRLRAGDPGGAEALLRATCARLERLAIKMLRGFPNVQRWADADDVLQGALVRLLRTLQTLRPESRRDFVNLAAVHIRRELLDLARHYRNRLDHPAGGPADSSNADPLVQASDRADAADLDLWSAFHEEVDRLPAEEREVLTLRFYHGWTQEQIAELFGVDERTVRRRWRSACMSLSTALGGRLPDV
jgi:RNA polymerase sigma-70 factor (ECF subfamily)